ncbi:hypothetical protein ALC57_03962 [Trachymyrmex cornetzi]|uniref:Uncharacterized protein n=1 Tax=Trachymyrmex cornetzi TaxID=471704 RepID=A0A151JLI8_9HYME|nr:hypothetical protein ALC57_03962 [Trachymyrmex cornetzi]
MLNVGPTLANTAANRQSLIEHGATSARRTLADTYSMTTFGQCLANVGTMLATGCYANLSATSAQAMLADSYFKTTSGHGRAKVGSTSGQRWQHVGNRWSRQSRCDVCPTYVTLLLLIDEARANVGSMSATGCHTNLGATSAQRTLADSYLLT